MPQNLISRVDCQGCVGDDESLLAANVLFPAVVRFSAFILDLAGRSGAFLFGELLTELQNLNTAGHRCGGDSIRDNLVAAR